MHKEEKCFGSNWPQSINLLFFFDMKLSREGHLEVGHKEFRGDVCRRSCQGCLCC